MVRSDFVITSFSAVGTQLQLDYSVEDANPAPFTIALYTSADGESLDTLLQVVEEAAPSSVRPHTIYFKATFADLLDDYHLLADVDDDGFVTPADVTAILDPFTLRA